MKKYRASDGVFHWEREMERRMVPKQVHRSLMDGRWPPHDGPYFLPDSALASDGEGMCIFTRSLSQKGQQKEGKTLPILFLWYELLRLQKY